MSEDMAELPSEAVSRGRILPKLNETVCPSCGYKFAAYDRPGHDLEIKEPGSACKCGSHDILTKVRAGSDFVERGCCNCFREWKEPRLNR